MSSISTAARGGFSCFLHFKAPKNAGPWSFFGLAWWRVIISHIYRQWRGGASHNVTFITP